MLELSVTVTLALGVVWAKGGHPKVIDEKNESEFFPSPPLG